MSMHMTKHLPAQEDERRRCRSGGRSFLKAVMADSGLSPHAKCVMFGLVIKHHNDETGRCNPSLSKIAEDIGRTRRAVLPSFRN